MFNFKENIYILNLPSLLLFFLFVVLTGAAIGAGIGSLFCFIFWEWDPNIPLTISRIFTSITILCLFIFTFSSECKEAMEGADRRRIQRKLLKEETQKNKK